MAELAIVAVIGVSSVLITGYVAHTNQRNAERAGSQLDPTTRKACIKYRLDKDVSALGDQHNKGSVGSRIKHQARKRARVGGVRRGCQVDGRHQVDGHMAFEADCCAVCLSAWTTDEVLLLLPCNHVLHRNCVRGWLHAHASCPVCKQDLNELVARQQQQQQEEEQQRQSCPGAGATNTSRRQRLASALGLKRRQAGGSTSTTPTHTPPNPTPLSAAPMSGTDLAEPAPAALQQ